MRRSSYIIITYPNLLHESRITFCSVAQATLGFIPTIDGTALNVFLTIAASPSILSLFGCRLMIHLKEVGERTDSGINTVLVTPTTV